MQVLTFKNSENQTFEMTHGRFPNMFQSLDGVSSAGIIVASTTGYKQQGSTYLSTRLGVRPITFELLIIADTQAELYEKRREVENIFNPLFGEGTLIYANDYIEKEITVAVDGMPDFQSGTDKQRIGFQTCYISLLANNPFFTDLADSVVKMEDFVGGLTYPKCYPIQYARRGDVATINNIGDTETPVKVEFRGPAITPKIELSTGEFIEVSTELQEGEKLYIDTAYEKLSVEKEDVDGNITDAFEDINEDSNLETFYLKRGENQLTFSSASGSPEVYITYRNLFVGV